MDRFSKSIAVIQGAPSAIIQELFRTLVKRRQPARIAGVIEESSGISDRKCGGSYLRSVKSGAQYSVFQDLGPGSTSCSLEGSGAIMATKEIEQDIAAGCDLIVLSKFAKLEASRSGLAGAFAAAIEADIPILTSVSPTYQDLWEKFAGPLFVALPPDPGQLERWWSRVRKSTSIRTSLTS